MIKLIIREVNSTCATTHYFNPQKDYDAIYSRLTECLGWDHGRAEDVASWAEMAPAGAEYFTDEPNVEIYLTEDEEN